MKTKRINSKEIKAKLKINNARTKSALYTKL